MAVIDQSPQARVSVLNHPSKRGISSNILESVNQPIVVAVSFFKAKPLNAILVKSFEISYGLVTQLVTGHSCSVAS